MTEGATGAATAVWDLEGLPVLDAAMASDHEAAGAAVLDAAEQSWIARNLFGFSILRYEDVVAMLRDKRWHSATNRILEMQGVTDPDVLTRRRTSILSAEGDEHTRLRRLVGPAFSPRAADQLRPFMRQVINDLLDPVTPIGRADLAVEVFEPYPIPIICELLGAPKSDWQLFSRWAEDILRIFNGNLGEDLPTISAAQDEMDEYTRGLIADRRSTPLDDLLTNLIAAEEAGDKLTEEELVIMVEAVLIGGTDTTRNQLGCSVALFAEHPAQWRLLAERPELAPRAVEETMRFFGAVRGTGRFASEDIVYKDVLFPAGTFIAPSIAAANRDRSVFADPGRFDITREPSGQPQLTFGSGIHYCLGAALARAEQQEALPLLARRLPDMEREAGVTWKPNRVGIFGPERLPVTFRPT
ncbi:MAG: cytochrome P450 [Desertimonas sp.]